ncbi:MAG: hypothetical protein HQL34_10230 [Alphaproteobacteria bacterium]|nr:hypothetical protein [Alphaproteobacteria bacterium]
MSASSDLRNIAAAVEEAARTGRGTPEFLDVLAGSVREVAFRVECMEGCARPTPVVMEMADYLHRHGVRRGMVAVRKGVRS